MLTLRLLGPAQVIGPNGVISGRVVQRRRIALLALLARAPGGAMSRDKVIAYLWPESDTETARHRLAVAIHELRKTLGKDLLISRGDDVQLNAELIQTDVVQFEAARLRGDCRDAVELYRGAFLDGFYISEAPDFESWAELERDQFARAYGECLEAIARDCAGRGDIAGEVQARRRLTEHDPFNTQAALDFMRALAAQGDRSSALQHGRTFAERLHAELGAQPDDDFLGLIEELKQPQPRRIMTTSKAAPATLPGAQTPRRIWRRSGVVIALMALVLLAASNIRWRRGAEAEATSRLAVLPFTISGSSELSYLGDGIVDLLSTSLDGAGDVRTVDAHALLDAVKGERSVTDQIRIARERLHASGYVTGTVQSSGTRVRLHAALFGMSGNGSIAEATVEGARSDVFGLIDGLTAQLIAAISNKPGERIAGVAALTTSSNAALKAYLAGEREYRAGRFASACDAFTRAVDFDSTFALANYRLALSMLWADVPDTLPFEPEARALRYSSRLSWHDQHLIQAFSAWRNGDAESAEEIYRKIVTLYPDDAEAWHQLGETLFHYNPLRGRSAAEADEAFAHASALDPDSWGAPWHRMLIAGMTKNRARFDSLVMRLENMQPDSTQSLELRAIDAYTRNDARAVADVERNLKDATHLQLLQIAWRVAMVAHNGPAAQRLAEKAANAHVSDGEKVMGYAAALAVAAGNNDRAGFRRVLTRMTHIDKSERTTLFYRTHGAMVWGASTDELQGMLKDVERRIATDTSDVITSYTTAGLLNAMLGRSKDVNAYASRVQLLAAKLDRTERYAGTVAGLRARAKLLEGKPAEALALLESTRNKIWFGWAVGSPGDSQVADRYLRAQLLEQAGRREEARRWYQSITQFSANDLLYAWPAQMALNRIARS